MRNTDTLKCTSRICPYIKECEKHIRDDTNDIKYSYIDLSFSGCDIGSGFDSFMPSSNT